MASCVCRPCRVDLSTARAARTAAEARSRARRAPECSLTGGAPLGAAWRRSAPPPALPTAVAAPPPAPRWWCGDRARPRARAISPL